jgi:mutator protein MutT
MAQDLFPKPELKTVTAHDLNGNLYPVTLDKLIMRVSSYGVLLNSQGQILLQRHPAAATFALPGGGVDLGETVESALIREFIEETGLDIKVGKLLAVKDDYFTYGGKYCQSVLVFYQVSQVGGQLISHNQEDVAETKFINLPDLNENLINPIHYSVVKMLL